MKLIKKLFKLKVRLIGWFVLLICVMGLTIPRATGLDHYLPAMIKFLLWGFILLWTTYIVWRIVRAIRKHFKSILERSE